MILNNKPLPAAIDLEYNVIGSMLVDNRCIDEVMRNITDASTFTDVKLQHVYRAMRLMYDNVEAINLITLTYKLKALDLISSVDESFVIGLTQKVGTTAHVEYNVRVLQQFWMRRKAIEFAHKTIANAYNDSLDVFDLMKEVSGGLDMVNDTLSTGKVDKSFAQNLELVRKKVEVITNKDHGELTGLTTGFSIVDDYTSGWLPGDLIVLAARPGMGKTALALKSMLGVAKSGDATGFCSLEMPAYQLTARTVAIESNFHLSQLMKKGFEKPEYFTTLSKVESVMRDYPIYICDEGGMNIDQIKMKARYWKRKHDLKFLVVDYIQIMGETGKGGTRDREVGIITGGLKSLAKELDIVVMALAQLSRKCEERSDKRPRLADLRESGSIEQDADTVLFLHRPEYYIDKGEGNKLLQDAHDELATMGANAELIFGKYRAGSIGEIPLLWLGDKTKYTDPVINTEGDSVVMPNEEVKSDIF